MTIGSWFYYDVPNEAIHTEHDFSIREAVHDIIYGTTKEKPRGTLTILQSLVKDSRGLPIKHPSSYKISGEGTGAIYIPGMTRTGFRCTESIIRTRIRPAGRIIVDELTTPMGEMSPIRDAIYTSYKDPISYRDVLIYPELQEDGYPILPVRPRKELNVVAVYPIYSDVGRIEYYLSIAEEQK